MGSSSRVTRKTDRKRLGERLNKVAKEGYEKHNQEVLWEFGLEGAMTRDLFGRTSKDWTWTTLPQIAGMVPSYIVAYGGFFSFEHDSEDTTKARESLEIYDYPEGCWQVCLSKGSRVLVIYTAKA